MKIAAVAYINFFDNEIKQRIVSVDDKASWKEAFIEATKKGLINTEFDDDILEWVISLDDDINEARRVLFSGEIDIVVTFMKN